MKGKTNKYIFISFSLLLLVFMLIGSRMAGVSCDEVLHYNQSVKVYNYFASCGDDQSALRTDQSYLKYYGQSYDNLTTFLIKAFKIKDIYGFRHLMATLAGWAAIIITALFAVWLGGLETGTIVILLFAVSPTFLGHSQNNLKDIPFALGYITGIFFTLRFLFSGRKYPIFESIMLIASIAFCMSIRAGGILLICYLFLFFFAKELASYYKNKSFSILQTGRKLVVVLFIALSAWFLSVLLWPYGLENPVVNPVKAHLLMNRFPLTFREIFEGKLVWTDYMPWYYFLKYMILTIPLTVLAGVLFSTLFMPRMLKGNDSLRYLLLAFSVIFPVLYVIYSDPNIYSGWRQLLFLYPGIVIFAATGISEILRLVKNKYLKYAMVIALVFLALHPVKFLLKDYPYAYIYFNPLAGGLKGANGNYETDYYFVGQREASEWLIEYLQQKKINDTVKVGSNFSAEWYFRNNPLVKNVVFRNEERSNYDWDYYISTNRYIQPWRLKNGLWPPENALKVVYAGGAPVCAVIERQTKESYNGYLALESGRLREAEYFFAKAVSGNKDDEMIFYNFAVVLNRLGDSLRAGKALNECLKINPFFEPGLMYAGKLALIRGDYPEAEEYFTRLTGYNKKYFEAYVSLAEAVGRKDILKARMILKECLKINPVYKPAILALADSYKESSPEIAEKYYKLAEKIK